MVEFGGVSAPQFADFADAYHWRWDTFCIRLACFIYKATKYLRCERRNDSFSQLLHLDAKEIIQKTKVALKQWVLSLRINSWMNV